MKFINLITVLVIIAVNALANLLPINGQTTGEVSAEYENFFTPAGITFSIWSVIYLSLLIFSVYQFISKRFDPKPIGKWLVINGLANIAWIVSWHYEYLILTIPIMLAILLSLVAINLKIKGMSWFVRFPFRIYFGWICVATIANIAVLLTYLEWNGFRISELHWGMLLVAIAGLLAFVLTVRKGFLLTSFAIAWGIFGIYYKQIQLERAEGLQMVCLAVVALILVSSIWTRRRI